VFYCLYHNVNSSAQIFVSNVLKSYTSPLTTHTHACKQTHAHSHVYTQTHTHTHRYLSSSSQNILIHYRYRYILLNILLRSQSIGLQCHIPCTKGKHNPRLSTRILPSLDGHKFIIYSQLHCDTLKRPYNRCCENLKFHLKVYETILVLYQICSTQSAIEDSDFWEVMFCTTCMVHCVKKDVKILLGLLDP